MQGERCGLPGCVHGQGVRVQIPIAPQEPQPHVRSGGGDSSHKTAVGCLLQHQTVPCRTWLNTVEETRQVGRPCAAARCAATSVSSVQTTWEQSDEWGVELRGVARGRCVQHGRNRCNTGHAGCSALPACPAHLVESRLDCAARQPLHLLARLQQQAALWDAHLRRAGGVASGSGRSK